MQVFVRFRPPRHGRIPSPHIRRLNDDRIQLDDRTIQALDLPLTRTRTNSSPAAASADSPTSLLGHGGNFRFTQVFGAEHTNGHIYTQVAQPLVDAVMEGYHATLLTYGQTGSGKTYSLEGSPSDHGIIPRVLEELFQRVRTKRVTVTLSLFQIYMEQVYDMLDATPMRRRSPLAIRERIIPGNDSEIYVEGLRSPVVRTAAEAVRCWHQGNSQRMVAETQMNEASSRSHSVLSLHVVQEESHLQSTLFLVDLAGSETQRKTQASGTVLEQACFVNKSLSALARVTAELATHKPHISYRDSKLTRLLTHALGGNSQTAILLACSNEDENFLETTSTLQFGQRASNIKNEPHINRVADPTQYKVLWETAERLLQEQKVVIASLERENMRLSEAVTVPPTPSLQRRLHQVERSWGHVQLTPAERAELKTAAREGTAPTAAAAAEELHSPRPELLDEPQLEPTLLLVDHHNELDDLTLTEADETEDDDDDIDSPGGAERTPWNQLTRSYLPPATAEVLSQASLQALRQENVDLQHRLLEPPPSLPLPLPPPLNEPVQQQQQQPPEPMMMATRETTDVGTASPTLSHTGAVTTTVVCAVGMVALWSILALWSHPPHRWYALLTAIVACVAAALLGWGASEL